MCIAYFPHSIYLKRQHFNNWFSISQSTYQPQFKHSFKNVLKIQVLVSQSCLTLCDPMDQSQVSGPPHSCEWTHLSPCSPGGSPSHQDIITLCRHLHVLGHRSGLWSLLYSRPAHGSCAATRLAQLFKKEKIYLAALALNCGMQDLVPWPGIEPWVP